jgi:hypothetical protein
MPAGEYRLKARDVQRKVWIALAGIYLAFSCSAPPQHVPEHEPELGSDASSQGSDASGVIDESPACPLTICAGSNCSTRDGATSCKNAFRLLGRGSFASGAFERVVKGDLRCGATSAESGECPIAGGTVIFELDLRDAQGKVDLVVEVDAEFDPALRLESESCVDPLLLACNLDHTEGVERAVLGERLSPGVYRLIVGAEELDASGKFELRVRARDPRARCTSVPLNDRCATAIDLDPRLAVQTVVGTTLCARDDAYARWYCNGLENAPDVFYRLDLRGEKGPKLLYATTDLPPTDFDTALAVLEGSHGECFDSRECNDDDPYATREFSSSLVALLEPGEYFIAVDAAWGSGDFGLRVALEEPNCPENDACSRALELDPTASSQTVPIDAACARSTWASPEVETDISPDVYYRLDLTKSETPVLVSLEADPVIAYFVIFKATRGLECGRVLHSGSYWLDAVLYPGDYYVMVSADPEGPRLGELDVELEPLGHDEFLPCIDEGLAECILSTEKCCDPWSVGCSDAALTCGLDPTRLGCVCDQAPECCEAGSPGAECAELFEACEVLCEGGDSTSLCEEAP